MKPTITDREFDKFKDVAGETAVRTTNIGSSGSPSGLGNYGLHTEVSWDDDDWHALPAVPLTGRNAIRIQNYSGYEIKTNYDNSGNLIGTPLPAGYKGMRVIHQGESYYDITDQIPIYAKRKPNSGAIVLDIEELA